MSPADETNPDRQSSCRTFIHDDDEDFPPFLDIMMSCLFMSL